jgi:hypothetical protein
VDLAEEKDKNNLVGEVSPSLRPPRPTKSGTAVSSATPSWVQPGNGSYKFHTSVGRTRERVIVKKYSLIS